MKMGEKKMSFTELRDQKVPEHLDSKRKNGFSVMFDRTTLGSNLLLSLRKLDPRLMWRNPVMFCVEVGATYATGILVANFRSSSVSSNVFGALVAFWLWITIIFANFAEAVAQKRGKAQADSLRRTRTSTMANLVSKDGQVECIPTANLAKGDICIVSAGEIIPGDGEIIDGIASVDESAITGESAPVIRESGGDRSSVVGGTVVLSDSITIRISARPGESFLDRMIALVEGSNRQKTPNEIALNILLSGLTIVFLLTTVTLAPFAIYAKSPQSPIVLVALLVCLIPTTIGALLSAIGIAGMDRLIQRNVLATSGRAIEAAGDCSTLLLDKTGTITYGNRRATEFIALPGVDPSSLARNALIASLGDETPEGRSIVDLAVNEFQIDLDKETRQIKEASVVSFSATTRMSGIDIGAKSLRKGSSDAILSWVQDHGGTVDEQLNATVERIAKSGGTPLAVALDGQLLGVVHLKDVVKEGIANRFSDLRSMGIRTVMVTGDNALTAAAIASEAGVDDFLAQATPQNKLDYIRKLQRGGSLVAMTGDGTNDAPALAQADVGVAMNSGTMAAKEAGNMVDLDSNPTKLVEIVEIGKQLLITRGSLTTFSIANDVAKFFAIIPAMFEGVYPSLRPLNLMKLQSPHSAILSAVIFNALVIVALIPLALRGVRIRSVSVASILRRNIGIYGVGGIIAPFLGIKIIDLIVSGLGVK